MKKNYNMKVIAFALLVAGFAFLFRIPVIDAQDTDSANKTVSKGIVVLKIKKDVNGKSTVIDTTFTIDSPAAQLSLEEYLEKHEKDLEKLSDKLRDIDIDIDLSELKDSILEDSMEDLANVFRKEIRIPHFKWDQHPGSFKYRFEFPCPDEFNFPIPGNDETFEFPVPEGEMKMFGYDSKESNLSDILGNIPMDRVKNYSIKERKNGKRIIIDIEDEPVIDGHQRKIIIQKHGGSSHKGSHLGKEM
jgi:hypothetical protein